MRLCHSNTTSLQGYLSENERSNHRLSHAQTLIMTLVKISKRKWSNHRKIPLILPKSSPSTLTQNRPLIPPHPILHHSWPHRVSKVHLPSHLSSLISLLYAVLAKFPIWFSIPPHQSCEEHQLLDGLYC